MRMFLCHMHTLTHREASCQVLNSQVCTAEEKPWLFMCDSAAAEDPAGSHTA